MQIGELVGRTCLSYRNGRYKECLEARYNTSFPKSNEDMILKGILDNVLWNMVGNKELCEHITENGKLYCYPECDTQMTENNAA